MRIKSVTMRDGMTGEWYKQKGADMKRQILTGILAATVLTGGCGAAGGSVSGNVSGNISAGGVTAVSEASGDTTAAGV